MHKILYWIIVILVFLGIATMGCVVFNFKNIPVSEDILLDNTVPVFTPTPSIDLANISNIIEVKEYLRQNAEASSFYKINWARISEVTVDGEKMFFGELEKFSGNKKMDQNPMPLFLVKGVLYAPYGYGGNPYDMKDTNWIMRYKESQISDYLPLQMINTPITPGSLKVFKAATGISALQFSLGKDGRAIEIRLVMGGQTKVFTAPLPYIESMNLVTIDANKDAPDYVTAQEKYRKLPGNVTEQKSFLSEMGYSVAYPFVINNLKVTQLKSGFNSYGFYIDDTQYDPDVATINCYQNEQQQVGPKEGDPDAIAIDSQSKLVDWGLAHEYHQDSFSFTGPGYYCQLRTTGVFRPSMFKIAF